MRLDARLGHVGYFIWHAERCKQLHNVQWIDDDLNMWFHLVSPLHVMNGEVVGEINHARRIDIYIERKLVIIDPIADDVDLIRLPERVEA